MVVPLCPRGWSIIARYLTWTTHLNFVKIGVRGLKCWTLVRNVGTCQLRKVYRSVAIAVGWRIPAARWPISTGIIVIWVSTAADRKVYSVFSTVFLLLLLLVVAVGCPAAGFG